jgi:hypothetical protein
MQNIDSIGTEQTVNATQFGKHSSGIQNKASERSHVPQKASSKRKYSTGSDSSDIVIINKQVKSFSGAYPQIFLHNITRQI